MIQVILLDGSAVDAPWPDPAQVLAPEEVNRYRTLRSDSRRREFLLGRMLLKAALTEKDHGRARDFTTIATTVSATGKPSVAGAQFSLSHDGEAVLLAVGDQPVGVDMETVQEFDGAMMDTCFSGEERRRIRRALHPDRVATLTWCIKEAVAKAGGAGIESVIGSTARNGLFVRGGFAPVAGRERAYAVCSPLPLSPIEIVPAIPRFSKVFAGHPHSES